MYRLMSSRDRFRTTINVMGDTLGTVIVNKLSQGEMEIPVDHSKVNAEPHELKELSKQVTVV